jgi:hypothetical protein
LPVGPLLHLLAPLLSLLCNGFLIPGAIFVAPFGEAFFRNIWIVLKLLAKLLHLISIFVKDVFDKVTKVKLLSLCLLAIGLTF